MSDEKKVFKDLTKFTVKRSEWLRGKGSDESGLLKDGKMCCLGFYAKAQGFPDNQLTDAASPGELVRHTESDHQSKLVEQKPTYGVIMSSDTAESYALMTVNDNQTITEEARETQLKEKFSELGIEVEFVD